MATVNLNTLFAAQTASENNSKKDMIYTTDDGTEYVVSITENFGEPLGFLDVEDEDVGVVPRLPRGWEMRKVRYSDATSKVNGFFYVGSPNTPLYREGGSITIPRKGKADGLVVAVTGSIGEKKRFGKSFDTGQNSGDNT